MSSPAPERHKLAWTSKLIPTTLFQLEMHLEGAQPYTRSLFIISACQCPLSHRWQIPFSVHEIRTLYRNLVTSTSSEILIGLRLVLEAAEFVSKWGVIVVDAAPRHPSSISQTIVIVSGGIQMLLNPSVTKIRLVFFCFAATFPQAVPIYLVSPTHTILPSAISTIKTPMSNKRFASHTSLRFFDWNWAEKRYMHELLWGPTISNNQDNPPICWFVIKHVLILKTINLCSLQPTDRKPENVRDHQGASTISTSQLEHDRRIPFLFQHLRPSIVTTVRHSGRSISTSIYFHYTGNLRALNVSTTSLTIAHSRRAQFCWDYRTKESKKPVSASWVSPHGRKCKIWNGRNSKPAVFLLVSVISY